MSNIIKSLSYFKNLLLAILVGTAINLPVATAEQGSDTEGVANALNSLISEGVNMASLNLQPTFDGVTMKSVGSSASEFAPTPFIIGGTSAPRRVYSDYVLVVLTDQAGNIAGLCGGTMIASNKVLTAAHCSQERASRYFVIPGFYSFRDRFQQSNIFPVSRVADHPEYNDFTAANDVAVLTLTRSYFNGVSAVLSGTDRLVGDDGTVIGTGLSSTNPRATPNVLQEVAAPITSNASCNNQWESFAGFRPIESNMMCAGFTTDGRGTCNGDSGGPLFVEIEGQRVIAGTVSFGFSQCEQNRATQAYARMTSMTDFIRSESPNTVFIQSNAVSITPVVNFLLSDISDNPAPGGAGAGAGAGAGTAPPLVGYPSLPARLGSGTDLVIAVLGDENDTIVGQTPVVFHLNSPQDGAQMVFQDIGLDEVNVLLQKPGLLNSSQLWIRTPQAAFPFDDLAVGTYAPAAPITVFSDTTKPSVQFDHDSNPCLNNGDGSFTITQVSDNGDPFAPTGLIITAVEGYFEVLCSDNGSKIRGRFRYAR